MKFKNYLPAIALLLLLSVQPTKLFSQVSGTFTIGGSSPDFNTLDSAFNYLENNGINGKVWLKMRSGTYIERTTINSISGASSSNTIYVGPDPSNSTAVRIKNKPSSTTTNYIVGIQQGYLQFDSLDFVVDSTSIFGGRIIDFTANCQNIGFNACTFYGKDTATTSTNFIMVYDPTGVAVNNYEIINCTFYNGSYSLYHYGSSSADEVNTVITNNKFLNYYIHSSYLYYQKAPIVKDNYAKDINKYTSAYGMYFNNCDSAVITGNQLYSSGGAGYGLYVAGSFGSATSPVLIANNFISGYDGTRSGAYWGLYVTGGSYTYMYYNSVYSNNLSTTSRAVYLVQSSSTQYSRYFNNNSVHEGGGYPIYLSSIAGIADMNNNNYYSTGANMGYLGANITSIGAWRTATSKESNSLNSSMTYKSATDLHTSSVVLNAAGTPISGITTDIDGANRNSTTPDIGADEFDVANLDAKITSVQDKYCPGTQSVIATLKNSGNDTIKNAKIEWRISTNGGSYASQTTYNYSGKLPSAGEVSLTLGSYNFSSSNLYKIQVIVTNPNGTKDGNSANDTLNTPTFRTSISGVMSIGGSSPDFPSIDSAFNALERAGICGPVRLNLRSGTYTESTTIGTITGASSTNTITLGPDPSNTSTPVITYAATGTTDNYVIRFLSTSYVNIDSITLKATGTTYGRVIAFEGLNSNISLIGDSMIGVSLSANTSTNFAVIFDNTAAGNRNEYLTINNCKVLNGSYGIYLYGVGSTDFENGNKVLNSRIEGFSYYGLYSYYQSNNIIDNNYIKDNNTSTSPNSLRVYYNDTCTVTNNYVFTGGSSAPDGIYFYYCDGSAAKPVILANNVVSMYNASGSGLVYGIYGTEGTENRLVYNTVNVYASSSTARALYVSYSTGDNAEILNNNINNYGMGFSSYFGTNTGITVSDHNNLFTKGSVLAYYAASNRNSLSDLQSASGYETNSVSDDPNFPDPLDLKPTSAGSNNRAKVLSYITQDITGNSRNTVTPDIGALEFDPVNDDLSTKAILLNHLPKCGIDSAYIYVVVKNTGLNSQSNFKVNLEINSDSARMYSFTYSGTLASQNTDTLKLGYFSTNVGGKFYFKTFTSLSGDQDHRNDTTSASTLFNTTPVSPTTIDKVICPNTTVDLFANKPTTTILRWFDKKSGGNLLYEGDTFTVKGLKADTSFYVASLEGAFLNGTLGTITGGTNGCGGGVMFDVVPKADLILDSLSSLTNTTNPHYVYIYIRNGSFSGVEEDASAWTLTDSVYVKPTSTGSLFMIPLNKSIFMSANKTYGVYINNYANYTNGNSSFSNDDVTINTGTGLCSRFDGMNAGRMYNGRLYYKVSSFCESLRTPAIVKVNPIPNVYLGKDEYYCETPGLNMKLDAGNGFVSYKWSTSDTTSSIVITQNGKYSVTVIDTNMCSNTDEIEVFKNSNPTVSLGADKFYCASDGINATLDPGKGYKTYKWSTGESTQTIDVTTAANYLVTVSDNNNCEATDTITITEIMNPVINLGKDTVYCTNSGLDITLTPGSMYNTFRWNTGDTTATLRVQSGGFFGLTFKDSYGCHGSDSIFIFEKNNPYVDLGNDVSYCKNEGIGKLLDAGPGQIKYLWSTGADTSFIIATKGGTYFVTVEDFFGCQGSDTIVINEKISPDVNLGKDTGYCASNGIDMILNAGAGHVSYKWSTSANTPSININTAGSYKVDVTGSNGCHGYDTLLVTMFANPIVNLGNDRVVNPDLPMNETLDAGNGFSSYRWSNGETTRTIVVTQAGKYKVTVKSSEGCEGSDSINVRAWIKGSISNTSHSGISIFPNPANQFIKVASLNEPLSAIEIFTIDGRQVYNYVGNDLMTEINTNDWLSGFYIIRIHTANNHYSAKICVTHP